MSNHTPPLQCKLDLVVSPHRAISISLINRFDAYFGSLQPGLSARTDNAVHPFELQKEHPPLKLQTKSPQQQSLQLQRGLRILEWGIETVGAATAEIVRTEIRNASIIMMCIAYLLPRKACYNNILDVMMQFAGRWRIDYCQWDNVELYKQWRSWDNAELGKVETSLTVLHLRPSAPLHESLIISQLLFWIIYEKRLVDNLPDLLCYVPRACPLSDNNNNNKKSNF